MSNIPYIGQKLEVIVKSTKQGADGKIYITIMHQDASNYPSLIWK